MKEWTLKKVLAISLFEGNDSKGNPKVKRYTYSNVKLNADAKQIYEAAEAISGLCAGSLNLVNTIATNEVLKTN